MFHFSLKTCFQPKYTMGITLVMFVFDENSKIRRYSVRAHTVPHRGHRVSPSGPHGPTPGTLSGTAGPTGCEPGKIKIKISKFCKRRSMRNAFLIMYTKFHEKIFRYDRIRGAGPLGPTPGAPGPTLLLFHVASSVDRRRLGNTE